MDGKLFYLMGPSGSGKDSLIEAAREPLRELNCEVMRRVITRSAESVGEDAIGVTPEEFDRRQHAGAFSLAWQANGLSYGIPREMDEWLQAGRHVLVNGSRANLRQAMEKYPTLVPVLLTVNDEVLRKRLLKRGRETLSKSTQDSRATHCSKTEDPATAPLIRSTIRLILLKLSLH